MAVDAHSSLSSLLPNAGQRMIAALATLWDAEGRPAVDGLDTGVVRPTDAQRAVVASRDLRDLDDMREHQGIERFTAGLDGIAAAEVLAFEPTLNLQGLWSGHIEPTPKTVIPAEAHARLDIRIVPDQRPADMVGGAAATPRRSRVRRRRDPRARGRARLVVAAWTIRSSLRQAPRRRP